MSELDFEKIKNDLDLIKKVKRDYYKKYREDNKDKLNKYQREYRANNKNRVKQYNQNYWIKKANLINN